MMKNHRTGFIEIDELQFSISNPKEEKSHTARDLFYGPAYYHTLCLLCKEKGAWLIKASDVCLARGLSVVYSTNKKSLPPSFLFFFAFLLHFLCHDWNHHRRWQMRIIQGFPPPLFLLLRVVGRRRTRRSTLGDSGQRHHLPSRRGTWSKETESKKWPRRGRRRENRGLYRDENYEGGWWGNQGVAGPKMNDRNGRHIL